MNVQFPYNAFNVHILNIRKIHIKGSNVTWLLLYLSYFNPLVYLVCTILMWYQRFSRALGLVIVWMLPWYQGYCIVLEVLIAYYMFYFIALPFTQWLSLFLFCLLICRLFNIHFYETSSFTDSGTLENQKPEYGWLV